MRCALNIGLASPILPILEIVWDTHWPLATFLDFFPAPNYTVAYRHAFISIDRIYLARAWEKQGEFIVAFPSQATRCWGGSFHTHACVGIVIRIFYSGGFAYSWEHVRNTLIAGPASLAFLTAQSPVLLWRPYGNHSKFGLGSPLSSHTACEVLIQHSHSILDPLAGQQLQHLQHLQEICGMRTQYWPCISHSFSCRSLAFRSRDGVGITPMAGPASLDFLTAQPFIRLIPGESWDPHQVLALDLHFFSCRNMRSKSNSIFAFDSLLVSYSVFEKAENSSNIWPGFPAFSPASAWLFHSLFKRGVGITLIVGCSSLHQIAQLPACIHSFQWVRHACGFWFNSSMVEDAASGRRKARWNSLSAGLASPTSPGPGLAVINSAS